ncbi:hypothetical protein ACFO1B_14320 [Dactylosporangium siamense]|uniref:Secreted protein n=1 Tax=Dactylosporangium siamense TaxID=685454 RepID=A0A919PIY7_9ACTN|nr:hypothetical protein [Dactylosporangium siamense]GIG45007.1 hypothetical protein Dsi01nite_030480 [Dactylosporangium siamense]
MRLLQRTFLVFLTAVLAVAVAPVAASADLPPAYHLTYQLLSSSPNYGMDPTCRSISIQLAARSYRVDAYYENQGVVRRPIVIATVYLEAAWYTWEDCLVPQVNRYVHVITLTSALHPSTPVSRQRTATEIDEGGWWGWGSALTPLT